MLTVHRQRRLLLLIPVLLGVTLVTFALTRIIPGNPIAQLVSPLASPSSAQALIHQHGLDQPLIEQYFTYVRDLAARRPRHLVHHQPAGARRPDVPLRGDVRADAVRDAAVAPVGVPLGIAAAVWRNGLVDHVSRVLSVSGIALPVFWTSLTLLYLLFSGCTWCPRRTAASTRAIEPPQPASPGLYTVDALMTGNWAALRSSA